MLSHSKNDLLVQLNDLIFKHFDLEEFRDLCFRLGVSYDNLRGENLSARIRELVLRMNREKRLNDLVNFCSHLRPNVMWPEIVLPTEQDFALLAKPNQGRSPRKLFLSYARQDIEFAERLATDLRKNGWDVWIAPESIQPGERWVEAINRGLTESGIFLLVLTPSAVNSSWVNSEANVAINLQHQGMMRFVPLRVEMSETPPLWQAYQWIPFQNDYQGGLEKLLRELDQHPTETYLVRSISEKKHRRQVQEPMQLSNLRRIPVGLWIVGIMIGMIIILWVMNGSFLDSIPLLSKEPQDTSKVRTKDNMEMTYVPAGSFLMGSLPEVDSGANEDEFPQHEVSQSGFWIDVTEVTNSMYAVCVEENVCTNSSFAADGRFNGSEHPVVGVSWDDANTYCQWVGGQLPTEAQWEYAARGNDGRLFPWGNKYPTCNKAQFLDCGGDTVGVGSLSPDGASPFGISDMAGNVWEWVADWHDSYPYETQNNPTGPESGSNKVLRGGSWSDFSRSLRVANRHADPLETRSDDLGFRCVTP